MYPTFDGQKDTRRASLVDACQKGSTLLLLQMALVVFGPLELLNKSLQSLSASVGQMLEAVKTVKQEYSVAEQKKASTVYLRPLLNQLQN